MDNNGLAKEERSEKPEQKSLQKQQIVFVFEIFASSFYKTFDVHLLCCIMYSIFY